MHFLPSAFLGCILMLHYSSAFPWPQDYLTSPRVISTELLSLSPDRFLKKALHREPSCDELRAMWRFSMRKSRVTEITNEIPTYKDPFAYNVWDSNARSRSIAGNIGSNPHIYGKMVHSLDNAQERVHSLEDMDELLTTISERSSVPRRVSSVVRLPSGSVSMHHSSPLTNSFKKLKEAVLAQRAYEVKEQQLAMKAAAQVATLHKVKNYAYAGLTPSYLRSDFMYGNNSKYYNNDSIPRKVMDFPLPPPLTEGTTKYFQNENSIDDSFIRNLRSHMDLTRVSISHRADDICNFKPHFRPMRVNVNNFANTVLSHF